MKVRQVVAGVRRAFDSCLIHAVVNQHCGKRSPDNQRLSDDHVTPSRGHAIRADADLNAMGMHRTIVTATHIILARPDEFYWRAAQTLGDQSRLDRKSV